MSGHTPGPWHVVVQALPAWIPNQGTIAVLQHSSDKRISVRSEPCVDRIISADESLINAALIAAAPETAAERDRLREINAEMLAALKVCANHITAAANGRDVWEMVHEAIAKAEAHK